MKIFYSLLVFILVSCNQAKEIKKIAKDGCPEEIVAVCGQPKMPVCPPGQMCPMVMPFPKTYKNLCDLNKSGAKFISNGACAKL